jgi:hypothetical protein
MPATESKTKGKGGAPRGNKNAVGNKGGGVPELYQPEFAEEAMVLCAEGFTDLMLGEYFGVTERTINNWKAKHVEFRSALKVGKDETDDFVERCTVKGISGYFVDTEETTAGVVSTVRKWIPGNPTAGLKWLAARRPDQYRETKNINQQVALHEGLRAALEEMSEQSKLRRAERAKLANPAKLIEQERIKVD